MIRALSFVLLAALVAGGASAQGLPSPYGLTFPRDGDGPLSALLRLRDAEADYRAAGDSLDYWSRYTQVRAWMEAEVGAHRDALAWFDATGSWPRDSVGTVPAGARAVEAAAYIAEAAESAQIVMVNEAHHDASSRLLTMELLPLLYERGFRYLAAETFAASDTALNARGHPVDSTGLYSREPTFAALVRYAARLGYTLVPYEIEHADEPEGDTLSRQQRRDFEQARHLVERTLGVDPDARVLVHAGYAHINEAATAYWTPMGLYVRERTGIDPFTVNQTALGEAGTPAYEHPAYRAADAAGLLGPSPVVIVDAEGPWAPTDASVDLHVFRPRAGDIGGRPAWLGRLPGRARVQIDVAACPQTCEVAVRRPGESAEAVPLDRVATTGGPVTLYVPREPVVVVVRDGRTGETLAEHTLAITD
ncbi:hypothetical protein [Rubrivirga sp. IMCC43871]|uniref:hypothetical protein n=1 Tax=Rubrivirga sp. IMCC43871 TaxID=3391575 RepID=UPI00398FFF94